MFVDDWWNLQRAAQPATPPVRLDNHASIIHANLLAYADAWNAEHGKVRCINHILRAWQLAPYRADRKREQLERAAREQGFA